MMLCEMDERREQNEISGIEESNQVYRQRRVSIAIGSVDKGEIGLRNNQSNQSTGSTFVEQNVCNQETGRRIEENNGLSITEHTIQIAIFYNERSEQGTGNMEEKRLGMFDGHQISIQPCDSNRRVAEILSVYAQGNTLYARRNAFRDLNCIEDLCKDNTNNNRQSVKQESSSDNELCRRHSVPDAGPAITRERDRVDIVGIQEIWMGDQREQKQIEIGLTICVSGMDV
ncbi:MAG: hypothetical protein EZS28_053003, partial [Streblomastix strix]